MNFKKILFDYQAFNEQNVGGISRVNINLINELKRKKRNQVHLLSFFSFNSYLIEDNLIQKYIFTHLTKVHLFLKVKSLFFSRILTNIILKYTPPDIFIPTYYDCYFLKSLGKTKMILIVHDMIHELFSVDFHDSLKIITNKRKLILSSFLIVTPSQCTKNDLLRFYPDLISTKIHVVNWASSLPRNSLNHIFHEKKKIILFVGKRESYKNFLWLINMISEWVLCNNFVVNCVGGGIFSDIETDLINKLNLSKNIVQKNVSDIDLVNLYTISFASIIPSLYEGFCFPIIEAMSFGCPVIYSNSSCLPEIAGFAGLKYTEGDEKALINHLNELLMDSKIYQEQIDLGILRSSEYSWEKTVFEFEKVLELK
jgi:glycosyltransferase involved in cell wall biosynthesis